GARAACTGRRMSVSATRIHTGLRRDMKAPKVLLALILLVAASVVLGLTSGAVVLSAKQVLAALWTLVTGQAHVDPQLAVITIIRLPRLLLALLVGAVLAVSGAAMQGLFRNPLADPGLIGVSSGAALGAVLIIVLGNWLPL